MVESEFQMAGSDSCGVLVWKQTHQRRQGSQFRGVLRHLQVFFLNSFRGERGKQRKIEKQIANEEQWAACGASAVYRRDADGF